MEWTNYVKEKNEGILQQTGNNNLIWHLFSKYGFAVHNLSTRQSINNYDKYALELWISTELMPENKFYKPTMKIF